MSRNPVSPHTAATISPTLPPPSPPTPSCLCPQRRHSTKEEGQIDIGTHD
jgi:hypothetical protein